jgi:hypothetical protein
MQQAKNRNILRATSPMTASNWASVVTRCLNGEASAAPAASFDFSAIRPKGAPLSSHRKATH